MTKKPTVSIASCIRADCAYLQAYFNQIKSLLQERSRIISIVLVHDRASEDGLSVLLQMQRGDPRIHLVEESEQDQNIDSIEAKAEQWAKIGNQGLEKALESNPDFILWVEADLTFPLDTVDRLVSHDRDIIAPTVMLGSNFYDSWGFRTIDGHKIFNTKDIPAPINGISELSSVGSCVLFKSSIFRDGVRSRGPYETGLLVGICNDARRLGYRVWVDTMLCVIHPTSLWEQQLWRIEWLEVVSIKGEILAAAGVNIIVASWYPDFVMKTLSEIPDLKSIGELNWFRLEVKRDTKNRTLRVSLVQNA
ncbi:MAG: Anp1 [Verrucomicrobiota bacterium]